MPPSTPAPDLSHVQIGEHRSRAVVQRDLALASAQLERLKSSGSPLVDIVAHGDWITMQAYFQKCGAELEAVKRSSKSIDYLNLLKELSPDELRPLVTSMADKVGPKGGGGTALHVSCMLVHGKLRSCR